MFIPNGASGFSLIIVNQVISKLEPTTEVGCTYYVTILSVTADHEDPVNSVAFTTLRMNSFLRTTMDTFSTTPADLRQAVGVS